MIDIILRIALSEIESGYSFNTENKIYTCLLCGKDFETGEVFPYNEKFYEASKAVRLHIEKEHGKMLDVLTSFDKKYTGITENQKELLQLISNGLSDKEIAKKTGVAPSTIRHQRFVFREKAKQAKLYLSIFEIVEASSSAKRGKNTNEELIEIHRGAKMVDDRYFITKNEEDKIIATSFESLQPLKLKSFSPKEKRKIVILKKISDQFNKGVTYSEKEINAVLKPIYEDYATIRRYLIEYGFMERTKDCKEYWLK